jgi:ornithine decarboxylase
VIHRAFESLPISYSAELWCEPGRALSAEYASVLVRVEARKDDVLYVNDGAYGALFDAAHVAWRFPVELVRETPSRAKSMGFSFYGPTCDDMDFMAGPFDLPADIQAGDYIEVGMLGAYGSAMRTGFNGFTAGETVIMSDEPMDTLYGVTEESPAKVIQLRSK